MAEALLHRDSLQHMVLLKINALRWEQDYQSGNMKVFKLDLPETKSPPTTVFVFYIYIFHCAIIQCVSFFYVDAFIRVNVILDMKFIE